MVKSLSIIFSCLLLGDFSSELLRVPIPGNVIGMLLLTTALVLKIVRLEDVKPASDIFIKNLSLFFIPPGVGLMLYFDLLRQELAAILIAIAISTLAVLLIVGVVQQRLESRAEIAGPQEKS